MDTANIAPRFETIDRQQVVLEPLDIEKLIEAGHPARNIWAILGRLKLDQFLGEVKAVEGHAGRNRWEPRLLIAMWIYAYSRGISSARAIERQCAYEPGLRWLTGLQVVNHHPLSDFRVGHGEALQNLLVQVLGILSMENQAQPRAAGLSENGEAIATGARRSTRGIRVRHYDGSFSNGQSGFAVQTDYFTASRHHVLTFEGRDGGKRERREGTSGAWCNRIAVTLSPAVPAHWWHFLPV